MACFQSQSILMLNNYDIHIGQNSFSIIKHPWCVSVTTITWILEVPRDNTLRLQFFTQVSLNHSRKRGSNDMVSLKEHQSNLKGLKTTWKYWWKYDPFVSFIQLFLYRWIEMIQMIMQNDHIQFKKSSGDYIVIVTSLEIQFSRL